MPHSLAPVAPRRFGHPHPARDRWPMPTAALAILALSATGWLLLAGAARALIAMAG